MSSFKNISFLIPLLIFMGTACKARDEKKRTSRTGEADKTTRRKSDCEKRFRVYRETAQASLKKRLNKKLKPGRPRKLAGINSQESEIIYQGDFLYMKEMVDWRKMDKKKLIKFIFRTAPRMSNYDIIDNVLYYLIIERIMKSYSNKNPKLVRAALISMWQDLCVYNGKTTSRRNRTSLLRKELIRNIKLVEKRLNISGKDSGSRCICRKIFQVRLVWMEFRCPPSLASYNYRLKWY